MVLQDFLQTKGYDVEGTMKVAMMIVAILSTMHNVPTEQIVENVQKGADAMIDAYGKERLHAALEAYRKVRDRQGH